MPATREQAIGALVTRLAAAASFGAVTRRLVSPETIASPGAPALAVVTHHETYHSPSPNLPPRRTLTVLAILYVDAGADPNVIPDALLNPLQDAVDAALKADDAVSGRCTLGGLVYAAQARGEVIRAPGDKTGKGLAVIPIDIVLP